MKRLAWLVVLAGCTAPFPAIVPFDDAARPDAQATDAAPMDARRGDARLIDAGAQDARVRDRGAVDAALDAAIDMADAALPPPPAPLITEAVTANRSLRDADGDTPDWLELHNPTDRPLALDGFTLSDDAAGAGWPLPDAALAPFESRVVFASGKDRRDAEWHTDFRLSAAGEVLRLTTAAGETVQRLDLPALAPDAAFGLPAVAIIAADDAVAYRAPPVDDGWVDPGYDDRGWARGPQGVGVDGPPAPTPLDHQRDHLLADWRFDAAPDGMVPDAAGAHPGHLANGAGLDPAGRGGGALSGEGDGWMAAGDPEGFDFAEAFTWSVWLRGVDDSGALISRNPAGTRWNQGSKALFVRDGTVQWDSGWVGNPRSGVDVTDDRWHHVAVTYDPAGDAFGIWVDGALTYDRAFNVDRFAEDFEHNDGQARTGLFIGRAHMSGGLASLDKYAGRIDDVTLWGVALPPEDVALLAEGARPGPLTRFGDRITTRLPEGTAPGQLRLTWPTAPRLALNLTADVAPGARLWVDGAPADPLGADVTTRGLPIETTHLAFAVDAADDGWMIGAQVHGLAATPTHLERPTPGAFNAAGLSPSVAFSRPDGAFSAPFELTLQSAAARIHFTLDGTPPTRDSPIYAGPITIEATAQVRARGYDPQRAPSPVSTARFVHIDPALAAFESPLPIIVIERFGQGAPDRAEADAMLLAFEPGAGFGAVTAASQTMVRLRGQSSANQPKRPYRLELRDDAGDDRALPLLGMPAEADWVLHAPYTDQSLIRNALVYGLGRDLGLPAPRAVFCELFMHADDAPMAAADHQGVYLLTETIEIGADRLDITELRPDDLAEPAISGGYLLKFEADVARDPRVEGFDTLELDSPEPAAPEQAAWIAAWLADFDAALDRQMLPAIDVESFVDLMIINELFRDQDAYVRSAWFYKDRDGPLRAGPLWDYNLTAGTGGFFENTRVEGYQFEQGYNRGEADWFFRLMQQPAFNAAFRDRWTALRADVLSDAGLDARIDDLAAQIGAVADRNFAIWDTLGDARVNGFETPDADTWRGQIEALREWLHLRAAWIDANP